MSMTSNCKDETLNLGTSIEYKLQEFATCLLDLFNYYLWSICPYEANLIIIYNSTENQLPCK